jgi:hypothetical protein
LEDKDKGKETKLFEIIEKGIEKVAVAYSENFEYQATLQSIPVIGPFVDLMIKETSSKIGYKRFVELYTLLIESMNLVDQSKVDYPYLESEDFYSLFYKFFERSMHDKYKEKRVLYVKILTNSILIENSHLRDNSEDFLSILDDLTPKDLILLKNIYEQQKNMQYHYDREDDIPNLETTVESAGWDELPKICNLDDADFAISLIKLTRCGLINEIVDTVELHYGGLYIITPLLRSHPRH